MANLILNKHRTTQEQRDTLQPYKKNALGQINVNERFIKAHGADAHPDKGVRDFYKKRGF